MEGGKRDYMKQGKGKGNKVVQLQFTKASDAESLERLIDAIQIEMNLETRSDVSQFIVRFAWTQFHVFSFMYNLRGKTSEHH